MSVVKEEQRMTPLWVWWMLLAAAAVFTWAIVQQVFFRLTLGSPSLTNGLLLGTSVIPFASVWYFYKNKLYTVYDKEGIRITYFPFVNKRIHWREIEKAEVMKYKFSYYGVLPSNKYGTIYSSKGSTGLAVETRYKRMLISVSHPDAIKKILELYCASHPN